MFRLFPRPRTNALFKARSPERHIEVDRLRAEAVFRAIEDVLQAAVEQPREPGLPPEAAAMSTALPPEVAVPTPATWPPRPRPSSAQRRNVPLAPIPS